MEVKLPSVNRAGGGSSPTATRSSSCRWTQLETSTDPIASCLRAGPGGALERLHSPSACWTDRASSASRRGHREPADARFAARRISEGQSRPASSFASRRALKVSSAPYVLRMSRRKSATSPWGNPPHGCSLSAALLPHSSLDHENAEPLVGAAPASRWPLPRVSRTRVRIRL